MFLLKEDLTDELPENPNKNTLVPLSNYYNLARKIKNLVYSNNYIDIYSNEDNVNYEELLNDTFNKFQNLLNEIGCELSTKINMFVVNDRNDFLTIHKDLTWITGTAFENSFFIVAPDMYNGELYANVVLHEMLHALLFLLYKKENPAKSGGILKYEEGFCVYFSTPLDKWCKELKKEQNAFYYNEALKIKQIYEQYGIQKVLRIMNDEDDLTSEDELYDTLYVTE